MIKRWLVVNKHEIRLLLMIMLMTVIMLPMEMQQAHIVPNDITFANSNSSLSSLSTEPLTSLADSNPINYDVSDSRTVDLLSSTTNKEVTLLPQKKVYLTFDDGPSKLTGQVLDILNESNIKATFFVLGEQVQRHPEYIARIIDEGHALGNHTYNHNYEELYKGFSPFWNQIKRTEDEISLITGLRPSLVRAPGGTAGHFDDTYFTLLKQGGYQVVDWNVDSGDSKRKGVPAQEIIKGATMEINNDKIIVLMHDGGGHEETVKALPSIISYYRDKGYTFDILSPELEPVQFKVTESARALKRIQPSEEWIAINVTSNPTLFSTGKRLVMEIGRMETDFKYGEYQISEGRIMVPLRATMNKLGVKVEWDDENKLVRMNKGAESIQMNVVTGQWVNSDRILNQVERRMDVPVQLSEDTIWVPLRELLQGVGYTQIAVTMNKEEWRVTTMGSISVAQYVNLCK